MSLPLLIFILFTSYICAIRLNDIKDNQEEVQSELLKKLLNYNLVVRKEKLGNFKDLNTVNLFDVIQRAVSTPNVKIIGEETSLDKYDSLVPDIHQKDIKDSRIKEKRQIPGSEDKHIMMIGTFQAVMRPMSLVMKDCAECPPGSALALVLRISQYAGVAPITFSSTGLRISRSLAFYSYFLVTIISFTVLSGFVLDLMTEPARSLRVRTPTARVIWIANLTIIILITSVAVYRAISRIECMINCLNQIEKIKIFLVHQNQRDSDEKLKKVLVILVCIGLWFLIFFDVYGYVIEALTYGREVRTQLMYSILYFEYFLILLVQLQFSLTALNLRTALQLVNEALENLVSVIDTQKNIDCYVQPVNSELSYVFKSNLSSNVIKATPAVPTKAINFVIDSLPAMSKTDQKVRTIREQYRSVRELSNAYGAICDVLRNIDEGHGLLLLLILGAFFLELIITPYYLITAIYTSTGRILNLLLQISWCIFHMISILIVIEPCYKTQKEVMDKTQVLICFLIRHVAPTDPMFVDINVFCKQLQLNRPAYTPLGMCILSRPLIVTIIGAVTTYLVIIFQFRTHESND